MARWCHTVEDYIINDMGDRNIDVLRNLIKEHDVIHKSVKYRLFNNQIYDRYKDDRVCKNALQRKDLN